MQIGELALEGDRPLRRRDRWRCWCASPLFVARCRFELVIRSTGQRVSECEEESKGHGISTVGIRGIAGK